MSHIMQVLYGRDGKIQWLDGTVTAHFWDSSGKATVTFDAGFGAVGFIKPDFFVNGGASLAYKWLDVDASNATSSDDQQSHASQGPNQRDRGARPRCIEGAPDFGGSSGRSEEVVWEEAKRFACSCHPMLLVPLHYSLSVSAASC